MLAGSLLQLGTTLLYINQNYIIFPPGKKYYVVFLLYISISSNGFFMFLNCCCSHGCKFLWFSTFCGQAIPVHISNRCHFQVNGLQNCAGKTLLYAIHFLLKSQGATEFGCDHKLFNKQNHFIIITLRRCINPSC